MAGDWIKMRVDLADDPAVIGIAEQLDIDEDTVVGKLHRLWAWADRQTVDGNAPHVTTGWVDRFVSVPGFADAMQSVGWLEAGDTGLTFPAFEKHNGQTAKNRSAAATRQARSRQKRQTGHAAVTPASQRDVIPRPLRRAVLNRDDHQCVYCGWTADQIAQTGDYVGAAISIDHVVPSTSGGKTSEENLVTACTVCNSRKSNRTPKDAGMVARYVTPKCDKVVTSALPREEKRREEKNIRPPIIPRDAGDVPADQDAVASSEDQQQPTDRDVLAEGFRQFWSAYPKQSGEDAARRAFTKAVGRAQQERGNGRAEAIQHLIDKSAEFARSPKGQGEFCPDASSWLADGRWKDDPATWQVAQPVTVIGSANDTGARQAWGQFREAAKLWHPADRERSRQAIESLPPEVYEIVKSLGGFRHYNEAGDKAANQFMAEFMIAWTERQGVPA